jgi:hypothetical protein
MGPEVLIALALASIVVGWCRRRSSPAEYEGIAQPGTMELAPDAVAWLKALHTNPPSVLAVRLRRPIMPRMLPGSDEEWRHTFVAARIRDRLALAKVGVGLDADMRRLVAAMEPVVAAERAHVERQFWALVDQITGEHPVYERAQWAVL